MSVILAKIMATQERNTVRFGYSFLPIANPKHVAVTVQVADPNKVTVQRQE